MRIQFRHRRGRFREPVRRRSRHRDRWLRRLSIVRQRLGRNEADARTHQPQRNHSDLAQSGHVRAPWRAPCATSPSCSERWPAPIADDKVTAASAGKIQPDYTKFLDPAGLKGARIGVVRKYFGFNDAVDQLMNNLIDEMKRAGAEITDPADIPTLGKFDDTELLVLLYELKADLAAYLARLGDTAPVKSLKDVIEFNEKHRNKEMPYFGQDIFLKAEEKGPLTTKEYRRRPGQQSQAHAAPTASTSSWTNSNSTPSSPPPGAPRGSPT